MIYQRGRFFLKTIFLLVPLAVMLAACVSGSTKWNPDDYTVKSGDTVYSIAWRYELDPEEFADWNNLGATKLIKPGQRLHTRRPANYKPAKQWRNVGQAKVGRVREEQTSEALVLPKPPAGTGRPYKSHSSPTRVKARKGDSLYALSRRYDVSVARLAQLNQLKKPYVIQPGQTIFLKPIKRSASAPKKTYKAASNKTVSNKTVSNKTTANKVASNKPRQSVSSSARWPSTIRWQRPAKGKIVKKFDRRQNDAKGIDIAGRQGDAIVASAAGKVVYSGSGLISYGNLIIIKHNKTYLSAYAYNRKLLVKEGDKVKAGQKIAEMGHKEKQSPRLHFEIRKNGKPVDPLKYLPW